jgi:hypothetical protein
MRTHKAGYANWREKVMNELNLTFKVVDGKIIYKGDLLGYKTLVDLLVSERIKLGISPF